MSLSLYIFLIVGVNMCQCISLDMIGVVALNCCRILIVVNSEPAYIGNQNDRLGMCQVNIITPLLYFLL